jgi:cytochrome b561
MTVRNTAERYGIPVLVFHWTTVLLLVAAFWLGLTMVDMDFSPQKLRYYSWHKWIGVTVFTVTFLRLAWRLTNPAPPLPRMMPRWQQAAAHGSHYLLYALLVVQPLVGWTMSSALGTPVVYLGVLRLPDFVAPDRDLAETLKVVHWSLAWLLVAAISVHVLAALHHHFHLRDGVLRRMLP